MKVSATLHDKVTSLKVLGGRFEYISAHDAIISYGILFQSPDSSTCSGTSPCFQPPILANFDSTLKSTVTYITNTCFTTDDPAWAQATIPVGLGSLGILIAVQLAPLAFVTSAAASSDLSNHILPARGQSLPIHYVGIALATWSN